MCSEFKLYDSKPIQRKALQMKRDPQWVHDKTYVYTTDDGHHVMFKAHQLPVAGDWVCYLNDADIYHVTDQVFRERNVVPA